MVIDGFGIGEQMDSHEFGDEGSNTYLNIQKQFPMHLPNLKKLGLDGAAYGSQVSSLGAYGKLQELVKAKDTTAGHWEMSGIIINNPFPTFPNGIPQELLLLLEQAWGTGILSGEVTSGTEVINRYGDEHLKTGYPIVYTSADSVLQIATHTQTVPYERLYEMCEIARSICTGKFEVGRVIARPFDGASQNYARTPYRRDYAVLPPENMLTKLQKHGFQTIGVGKISDIFAGVGIAQSYPEKGNVAQLEKTIELLNTPFDGLLFANYLDTDQLYGHRNDPQGYAKCLEQFDEYLGKIMPLLALDDILIITGDHGNDPTTPSTDHSREYTPVLFYGAHIKSSTQIGTKSGFYTIAATILDYFGIEKSKHSVLDEIKK